MSTERCVSYGRHFASERHTRAECPALLPFESVAEPGSVDMSEEFDTSMQKAFIEGAEWGSRPF
jgi:hypothetical protein